jgi:hypothetical protein
MGRDGPHWTAGEWDDEEERRRPPPRSRLLLVLAAAPWLVVVWLLGAPGEPAPAGSDVTVPPTDHHAAVTPVDPGPTEADHGAAGPTPMDEPRADPVGPPGDAAAGPLDAVAGPTAASPGDLPASEELLLVEQRGRWRVEAGAEEAAALAVVVARAWLTDHDPRLAITELTPPEVGRYAEHLVVEAVEATAPELTVVTLLAVLLDGRDELAVSVRRLAVPIALDATGARPAGTPWWLPGPTLDLIEPSTRPIADADEVDAATAALAAAGYEDLTVDGLEELGGTAAVATVRARTADGERVDGPVVLRRHLDRWVVAGDVLARAEQAP